MSLTQMSHPLPGEVGGEDPALVGPRVLESLLRRIAGDGPVNLFRAKAEVDAVLSASAGTLPEAAPPPDALPSSLVPSVAGGSLEHRVLAEIDQDGFAFAKDPRDEPFFNRRARRAHRQQNLISEMAREINARGVAPLDVKLGSFIRGARTGRLYWLDFGSRGCSHSRGGKRISPPTGCLLEDLFDLTAHGHIVK